MLALIIRRPGVPRVVSPKPAELAVGPVLAAPSQSGPLILKLANVTQQTPDAKTLRFIVGNDRKLSARPGQFLTLALLFDGKKVLRSYTICSSPARSGYVEITPKRVPAGCASVFLHDRASLGMTIEANGPFGHFCFDENKHRNVVLLAGGSGITPMIAMLRYMDDLCLETNVILLYCVRTCNDIIFKSDLEELRTRLKNFQYQVLLSDPHPEWYGPRGHISREFIQGNVKQLGSSDFFLCGPPPFMGAGRRILIDLGVKPQRIRQESFGAAVPTSAQTQPVAAEAGVPVEFARSRKAGALRAGQTLLQAAEEHGIAIPFSCRQGQCGTCKTKLLEGVVTMDAEEGLDAESKAQGFVLTCVGHATGPVKLDA